MKLGVIVSPAAGWSYTAICDLAQLAEKSGFDSFWVSDHFFGGPGGTPDRNCLEAWTLLAALARDTTTIRLGVLVAAIQYRNPALQAQMAAGVDHISGGRLEFGGGAGWKEDEYRAYGYDYPSPGDRVEQLRDGLEITRRLWQDDRATYHGKHYRIDDAVCAPKPTQRPRPPIWIGGARPRVLRVVPRHADGFDLGKHGADGADLTPDQMAASFRQLEAAERTANREKHLQRSSFCCGLVDRDAKPPIQ